MLCSVAISENWGWVNMCDRICYHEDAVDYDTTHITKPNAIYYNYIANLPVDEYKRNIYRCHLKRVIPLIGNTDLIVSINDKKICEILDNSGYSYFSILDMIKTTFTIIYSMKLQLSTVIFYDLKKYMDRIMISHAESMKQAYSTEPDNGDEFDYDTDGRLYLRNNSNDYELKGAIRVSYTPAYRCQPCVL